MTSSTVTMIAQEGVAWSVQAVGVQISIQLSAAELILQLSMGCRNAQFYRASKTDLYTIYLSDRTRYSYRDRISDLCTKICVEIGWKMYKYKSDL